MSPPRTPKECPVENCPVATGWHEGQQQILNEVSAIRSQMDDVVTAIMGDVKYGHRGLVKRVDDAEKSLEDLQGERRRVLGYVAGAVAVIVVGWAIFTGLFKR